MTTLQKNQLEIAAIQYFIKAYPQKLKVLEHSDKPDFTLIDGTNNQKIGAEIAHLYHDKKEAQILLGNSEETIHGIMCADDLIKVLNSLINQKTNKIKGYRSHDKSILVIRVASPIFDKSTFDMHEDAIICPKNDYDEIWLVLDGKKGKWTELKQIKSTNITQHGLAGSRYKL